MSAGVRLAAVILAGGESRRMGSPKALLRLEGTTFLDSLIVRLAGMCAPVIVVLGHEPGIVRAGLSQAARARIVVNPRYRLGQLTSLQAGLAAVPEHCDAILFTPVDYAPVRTTTLQALVDAAAAGGASLIYPRHQGRKGHPVVITRAVAEEIAALAAGDQARSVTARHLAEARFVEVDDPAILSDVDTPADYQRMVEARP